MLKAQIFFKKEWNGPNIYELINLKKKNSSLNIWKSQGLVNKNKTDLNIDFVTVSKKKKKGKCFKSELKVMRSNCTSEIWSGYQKNIS